MWGYHYCGLDIFYTASSNSCINVTGAASPQDDQADLLIHSYVDNVMEGVMKRLGIEIPEATSSQTT